MGNNLLSGAVGGFVGTVLNTPSVPIPSSPALYLLTDLASGPIFAFRSLALMLSSRESKAQQEFPEFLSSTTGHTLRKCRFHRWMGQLLMSTGTL